MLDALRLLLFPIIGVGVGVLYLRTPKRILACIRAAMIVLTVLTLSLLVTGLFTSGVHRLAGHLFVRAVWYLTPAAIAVSIGESIRTHRWLRLMHVVVPVLLFGIGVFAALTGYLPAGPDASESEQLQFLVLHQIGLPILCGSLLATWMLLSRRYARD